jgi:N,N-dimethylformamidase
LWRHRGLAPNKLVGIGFSAQGWNGKAPGYKRKAGSFDPRAAFIFEGVGPDETIGDFGLAMGGAAGDEVDRVDYKLGTPPHTLILASSEGHNPSVMPVIEDFDQLSSDFMAGVFPTVRADLAYFETPNGGAVFSTGAITWMGSLSHNNYANNVSRITENVLRKFSA